MVKEATARAVAKDLRRRVVLPIYKMVDDHAQARILGRKHKGEEISCTKGCAGCCYQLVRISGAEALSLASELLNRLTKEELQELKAKLGPAKQLVLDHPTLDGYMESATPCIFLKAHKQAWQGTCSIYESRPVACRIYHVVTPKEWCHPGQENAKQMIGQVDTVHIWLSCETVFNQATQESGWDSSMPLAFGLSWAFLRLEEDLPPPAEEMRVLKKALKEMFKGEASQRGETLTDEQQTRAAELFGTGPKSKNKLM